MNKDQIVREGYQQGDVILYSTTAIPADAKKVEPKNGYFVVAEGEHTGHFHGILAEPGVQLYEKDGVLYLSVEKDEIGMIHQEHHTQLAASGVYQVGTVQEVDPFTEEIRNVAD